MPWIILTLLGLAFLFSYWGWRWESSMTRPPLKRFPMVSVIIPSYNSPRLRETVESAKRLDYPRKEIIVADDSPHDINLEGVKLLKSRKRRGKSRALNEAVSVAKGEILFFLDSDTVASPDCLKRLVPWFRKGVAAVSPKFSVRNKTNFLTKLISLEHYFLSSLFKIHMYFGSLISFRGCGVAIRKDVILKLGGWRETMIEDTDLATTMVKAGYKIMYEPKAVVKTWEPSTWGEFKKQRLRWGKGTGFSYFHHYKYYMKNLQFGLYIFPYLLLFLAITGFLLYQTTLYLLPLASVYLIYTLSFKELVGVFAIFILPLLANIFTSVTAASITHVAIVTNSEWEDIKDIALIIPYVFFFFPATMFLYLKGIFSAISDKRKGKKEVDFANW
jgi:cellulose synthase/poly-beta-1,6-N-acetylglucosamine synthase-like glycosyltransferase